MLTFLTVLEPKRVYTIHRYGAHSVANSGHYDSPFILGDCCSAKAKSLPIIPGCDVLSRKFKETKYAPFCYALNYLTFRHAQNKLYRSLKNKTSEGMSETLSNLAGKVIIT